MIGGVHDDNRGTKAGQDAADRVQTEALLFRFRTLNISNCLEPSVSEDNLPDRGHFSENPFISLFLFVPLTFNHETNG